MQWPRPVEGQPQEPATLVLRVEGPMALEIQHSSDVILERVNRFFGWHAVGRLALRQAPLSRRNRPKPPRVPDAEGGRRGCRNPGLGRGRGIAGRAGAARRFNQAKLSRWRRPAVATRHCHNDRFKLAKASFSDLVFGRERADSGADLDHHAPRLHRRPVADRACRPRRLLAAAPDHGSDGAERGGCRKTAIAAGHGARPGQRHRHHHRIRLDDLPALRQFQRDGVPEAQVGIHRQRQDPLRVPRVPARHQGGGRRDAGALHRQGRCPEIFRRHRPPVPPAERMGDEEHHGDADADRQAGRPEPAAGRGVPQGPGAARQDRRRPEICQ